MISVCIATYNGEKFIEQQLMSILSQLGENDEIIISDDKSKDKTKNIISGLNDKRIKIIEGPHAGSPTKNFEEALKHATGDYIFLADQDDVWKEGKVETCMTYLKKYCCVISDANVTDGNLTETCHSFFQLNRTKSGKWYNLLIKNGYLGCCMAFRKELLDVAIPFPEDTPMHDIWLGNVAAFKFNVCFIPQSLILFRRHGHNSSSTARKSTSSLKEKINFRYAICKGLLNL